MDGHWRSSWHPTIFLDNIEAKIDEYVKANPEFRYPDAQTRQDLKLQISACTRALRKSPYDPKLWLRRAKVLLQLRYPELAAGDSYKALLLITGHQKCGKPESYDQELAVTVKNVAKVRIRTSPEKAAKSKDGSEGNKSSLESTAVLLLGQALFFANSFEECLEITKNEDQYEHVHELAKLHELVSGAYLEEMNYHLRNGSGTADSKCLLAHGTILAQPYPWLMSDMRNRDESTISAIKENLLIKSKGKCSIGKSPNIQNTQHLRDSSDHEIEVLGIFAVTDLCDENKILVDRTAFSAASESEWLCSCCCGPLTRVTISVTCCNRNFCSESCYQRANAVYHRHGKHCNDQVEKCYNPRQRAVRLWHDSDSSLRHLGECDETSARLLLRVLTSTVIAHRRSNTHPLKTPILGRLTSVFGSDDKVDFSLEADIAQPIKILQGLGIDVFANQDFDTWVIQSIQHRIRTNSWEHVAKNVTFIAVSPLFSFFNHSCDPNVTWDNDDTNTTLTMYTTRNVQAGEELFISYLAEQDLELPVDMRQEKMKAWTDQCQCKRCTEELEGLERALSKTESDNAWSENEETSSSDSE